MSIRGNQPRNRSNRRSARGGVAPIKPSSIDLPGPIRLLGNPKLFGVMALVAGGSMVFFLFAGALGLNSFGGHGGSSSDGSVQGNEAPDLPHLAAADVGSTTTPDSTPGPDTSTSDAQPVVKRYTSAPPLEIDAAKTYTATISTSKGIIEIELFAADAPQAVNAFVFLANDGYYDETPFMELTKDAEGDKFYAQAGDPTGTGLGTPGFSVPKELTDHPFARGYVGMGGSAENSNGGQFFISFDDYPALDGKYTIFGKVTSGLDVLDHLSLLDLTCRRSRRSLGTRSSRVTISES